MYGVFLHAIMYILHNHVLEMVNVFLFPKAARCFLLWPRNRTFELVSKKLDKRTEPKPRSVQNIQMDYCKIKTQHMFQLSYSQNTKKMEILKL